MSFVTFSRPNWRVALIFGFGLLGCRAPMPPQTVSIVTTSAQSAESAADAAAWAELKAAQAEYRAAWQDLQALKQELGRAKERVEAVRQQLTAFEGERVSESEILREKTAALEAALTRSKN